MNNIKSILKQYWGYDAFKPLQLDIITSVLQGEDTLALLPTGGGKSICFQVPALAMPGCCLVISPLIALMKDQVENLQKRNIDAIAIYSGMSHREIDIALDNVVEGKIKFLYVSPERLTTEMFKQRVAHMAINLIAVDEAHCISQWGYDFRPSYLKIAEIRNLLPKVAILALTATATLKVCDDIQDKLGFTKNNWFKSSFERKNIGFIVREEEDKFRKLIEILKKIKGSGIVYVRNRKKTKEIAEFLIRNLITADFYHAGLPHQERAKRQDSWIENRKRIMVCTNAFGMGIDKPDVRIVVHWDIPESIEAYYQEAGRAGRDGKKAFAGLLYNQNDLIELEKFSELQHPPIDYIKETYHKLCNFLQLAIGAGEGESYNFDIGEFCKNFKLNTTQALAALKILQLQSIIYMSDSVSKFSTIMMAIDRELLYKYQVENKKWDGLIKLILRMAPGVFDDFVAFRERELAFHLSIGELQLAEHLFFLQQQGVLHYSPQKMKPQLVMLTQRFAIDQLLLDVEFISWLKNAQKKRTDTILAYVNNKTTCRAKKILTHFGEKYDYCGQCDVCVEQQEINLSQAELDLICNWLQIRLSPSPLLPELLYQMDLPLRREKFLDALSYLIDNKMIEYNTQQKLVWKGENQ